MTNLQINLSDSLRSFVESQVTLCGYDSAEDYLCSLLRREQRRKLRSAQPGDTLDSNLIPQDTWPELHAPIDSGLSAPQI